MNSLALPVGSTGLYNTHPFVATSISRRDGADFQQLFAFADGYGVLSSDIEEDEEGKLDTTKSYRWVRTPRTNDLIEMEIHDGYNCVTCNNFNKYAESNLTGDRHICFSCRASYSWKYADEFLSNVKGL